MADDDDDREWKDLDPKERVGAVFGILIALGLAVLVWVLASR